ncbi:hypothetical protein B0H16DRAFT_1877633 [Mycena metata]|uniref:DUF2786 domain-containing protein n=1 Tax=Mycena metata TaxID=1033252 RepID=A0AAD7KHD9_9AGAR|nr:hypothetical protein B0H16DRAFT_1877633 [Mycena metata]
MGKRHRYESSDSDEASGSGSDSEEYMAPAKSPQKKARKSNPKIKVKAEVTIRATDTPLNKMDSQKRLEKIDGAVIDRIKKALALVSSRMTRYRKTRFLFDRLASHEQTGEAEARAALRMASKLLERHNVTQAEVMAQESEAEQLKRAGTSIVSLKSTVSPTTSVSIEAWSSTLAAAMDTFFDCQSYNTRFNGARPKVDWAFYGLAEQTVAAAHAYEMTYNLILNWSLKPDIGKGVHAKNCYRTGVARGLYDMAEKEKAQDKERAKKKEQALLKARQEQEAIEDKARLDRLEGPQDVKIKAEEPDVVVKPEPDRRVKMEEVDDDDDLGGQRAFDQAGWTEEDDRKEQFMEALEAVRADFNDEDDHENLLDLDAEKPKVKRSESTEPSLGSMGPPASVVPLVEQKVKGEPEEDDSPWSSVGQLVAFREKSIAVGDEYLKSQGVKLVKGRKRKALEFKDSDARKIYLRGKKDAQNIDVRQKRVKDVGMDD